MTANGTKRVSILAASAVLLAAPALAGTTTTGPTVHRVAPSATTAAPTQHTWYGTVRDVHGVRFTVVLRNGKTLDVDNGVPVAVHHALLLFPGRPVIVEGAMTASGVVRAQVVLRSHTMQAYWPADR